MQKPKVEHVSGLSPAISIEQKTTSKSPRSTVGTVTEVYDYLRILYARLGQPYCPTCGIPIGTQTADEIIDKILALPEGTKLYLMAPLERKGQEKYEALWDEIRRAGLRAHARGRQVVQRGRAAGHRPPPQAPRRGGRGPHRRAARARGRASPTRWSRRSTWAAGVHARRPRRRRRRTSRSGRSSAISQHLACDHCGRSFEPLNPHHFSFNSPLGWCPTCEGLGVQHGANPACSIRDPQLSLRDGAVAAWPAAGGRRPVHCRFAEALARHVGFSLDTPFDGARRRRTSGPCCTAPARPGSRCVASRSGAKAEGPLARPPSRFQYKGLFPAIDEASRVSFVYRQRLDHLVGEVPCSTCHGSRLRADAAAPCASQGLHASASCATCRSARRSTLFKELKLSKAEHAGRRRGAARDHATGCKFLVDVGLDYLTPRPAGADALRRRGAAHPAGVSQIGSGLTGVLYVLDEPTIGLHPRDNARLLEALHHLRDLGNTLVLVEHDREVIAAADYLLDFGPGAGDHGGEITAARHAEAGAARRRRR